MPERALRLSDDDLLAECALETLRVSGPGGQHRNRRDSAVRLRHLPTGTVAQAYERRSQHRNREMALHRLRRRLALEVRESAGVEGFVPSSELAEIMPGAKPRLGPNHDRFWTGAGDLLDLFVACGCAVADTARALSMSSSALAKLLLSDPDLMTAVNGLRKEKGLRPLRL